MILISWFLVLESSFTSRAGPLAGPMLPGAGAPANPWGRSALFFILEQPKGYQTKHIFSPSTKTPQIRESINPCQFEPRFVIDFHPPHPSEVANVIELEGIRRKSTNPARASLPPSPWHCKKWAGIWHAFHCMFHYYGSPLGSSFAPFPWFGHHLFEHRFCIDVT